MSPSNADVDGRRILSTSIAPPSSAMPPRLALSLGRQCVTAARDSSKKNRIGIGIPTRIPTRRRHLAFFSSRPRRPPPPPPFSTVDTCPEPTCGCAATPAMPEGLLLDREGPMKGAIAGYAEQVLVCTGHNDWPSRIEEESSGDNLAADLKELFGRGGTYSDVSCATCCSSSLDGC